MAIAEGLTGQEPRQTRPRLQQWFSSYRSTGRGQVTTEGFPEPYIGSLPGGATRPRVEMLGLNPGAQDVAFQAVDGIFADEIRQMGSYSAWAASGPYRRAPWITNKGPNVYRSRRLAFGQRWTADPTLIDGELLTMELYPWHSTAVTGTMAPDPAIIREFVWEPIADADVETVFAFGKPWVRTAEELGLPSRPLDVPFTVPSRRVRAYDLLSGQRLIVLWYSGAAGPPNSTDVEVLRLSLHES